MRKLLTTLACAVLISEPLVAANGQGFAPQSLVSPMSVSAQGIVNEAGGDSYNQNARLNITGPTTFSGGTYSYSKTGLNSATISYQDPDSGTDTSDEEENGSLSLTFTSPTGGSYTSSGTFMGVEYTDAGPIPYSGSFTGSGSFTLSLVPASLIPTEPSIVRTIAGPVRIDSGSLTIRNDGDVAITTTISSDQEWLTISSQNSTLRLASFEVTIAAQSDYDFSWDMNVRDLPLGTLRATIASSEGGLCIPAIVSNVAPFLPRVIDNETSLPVSGATFRVTQPNSSTFIAVSGADGYPSPAVTVLSEGAYQLSVTANGYLASDTRQAIVSNLTSQFPVFSLSRPAVPNTPPTLTPIPTQQGPAGSAIGPIEFTIGDAETPAADLDITAISSNKLLVPEAGISFAGVAESRSISFAIAAGQSGSSKITITVSDGVNFVSKAFLVIVPQPATGHLPGNPPPGGFTFGGFDDFDDQSKDSSKWAADVSSGNAGNFTETSQRVEFTCDGTSDRYRSWILSPPGYDKDWEVSVEVSNLAPLSEFFSEAGIGLSVFETTDNSKSVQMELYRYHETSSSSGYYSSLNGGSDRDRPTGFSSRALKIAFDSGTKVLSCYQGSGSLSEGYVWTEFASYGIAGSGGTRGNTDWGMSGSQQFRVALFAYSDRAAVTSGTMHADNFRLAPIVSGDGGGSGDPLRTWFEINSIDPDSPEAALDYDGDADGSDNLLEYAFGTNVNISDPAPTPPGSGLPGLPNVGLLDPAATVPKLRIEYVRRSASTNPGIIYAPEFSCSMEDSGEDGWQLAVGAEQVFELGDGWERVVIEDTQSACTGPRFGRVKIIPYR